VSAVAIETSGRQYVRIPYTDEADWLEKRFTGIGASEAAAAVGLSPYEDATPYALWQVKTRRVPPKDLSDKLPVTVGKLMEEAVATLYSERTGRRVQRVNAILRSKSHAYMQATLDRRVIGEPRNVECKTAGWFVFKNAQDWGPDGSDIVPFQYFVQAQHQMAVSGDQVTDLPVLADNREFRIYEIPRDEKIIEMLRKHEGEFWQRVIDDTPPPLRNLPDVLLAHPTAIASPIIATQEIAQLVGDMQHTQSQMKSLQKYFDERKAIVAEFMGDHDTLTIGDEPIVRFVNRATTSLDGKRLKLERADIYEAYVRRGTTRAFVIKGD
jgi:putative phage-type endonuclease